MSTNRRTIAAAHLAPVFLDSAATTAKAVDAIDEAGRSGAELIAFPESFIPGFPVWAAVSAPIYNHALFESFVNASIYIDGPEIRSLRHAALRNQLTVSVGISERSRASVGSV